MPTTDMLVSRRRRNEVIRRLILGDKTLVRAKFVVESYETRKSNTRDPESEELRTVRLTAVSDGSEENKKFFRWTPNGTITIGVLNPEAWTQLELGKSYYVDFTEAVDAKPA